MAVASFKPHRRENGWGKDNAGDLLRAVVREVFEEKLRFFIVVSHGGVAGEILTCPSLTLS